MGRAAGLAIALFVTKPLAMFLAPGLKPADPLSFAAVGPVRTAVKIDPNAALRAD